MPIKDNTPRKCRLCNTAAPDFKVASDYVYAGLKGQKFYLCPHCQVSFLYPAMDSEQEKYFYAREFEKFMEKRSGKSFDWSGPQAHIKSNKKQYERRIRFFKDLISPGKRVLEIGCSSGFMLFPLKEKGMEVVGIEPSAGFRNFLHNSGIPAFDSLNSLKKSNCRKEFDLVLHFFVLEHVREPINFLKEAADFIRPKGNMLFEVPSRSDPLLSIYNIAAFQKFYWSVAHNYYFNKDSLEYAVKRVSPRYEIINEQRYDISNHMIWALKGTSGGQGMLSSFFTPELEKAYLQSMVKTGYCDTLICRIQK